MTVATDAGVADGVPEVAEEEKPKRKRRPKPETSQPKAAVELDEARAIVGGFSRSYFYKLISLGIMPRPLRVGERAVWLVSELHKAVEKLAKEQPKDQRTAGPGRGATDVNRRREKRESKEMAATGAA